MSTPEQEAALVLLSSAGAEPADPRELALDEEGGHLPQRRSLPVAGGRVVATLGIAAACCGLALLGSAGLSRSRRSAPAEAQIAEAVDMFLEGHGQIFSNSMPGSCLWFEHGKEGAQVALRRCNIRDVKTTFVLPGREGHIALAGWPELCLARGPGGLGRLQIRSCDEVGDDGRWSFTGHRISIDGPRDSTQCLRAGEGDALAVKGDAKAGEAILGDCTGHASESWHTATTKTPFGHPSMYCMLIFMPGSYEHEILKNLLWDAANMDVDAGIFGCDEFQLFAKAAVGVGWHHNFGWVKARAFKQAPVGTTPDGWAAMVDLILNAWEVVHADGVFLRHDWTLKTDPDAVIVADRLREHLWPLTAPDSSVFVRNCNLPWIKELKPPLWPMMHGPGEAMTKKAMLTFFARLSECRALPYKTWGEDVWIVTCLNKLGVDSKEDWKLLADDRCQDQNYPMPVCSDKKYAIYHAMKGVIAWRKCFDEAGR